MNFKTEETLPTEVIVIVQSIPCIGCNAVSSVPCGEFYNHLIRYGVAAREKLISNDAAQIATLLAKPSDHDDRPFIVYGVVSQAD
jgi:hypothetical protein